MHAQQVLTHCTSPGLWQMVGSGCSGDWDGAGSLSLEMEQTASGARSRDAADMSGQCCCLYCEQSECGGLALQKRG